MKHTWPNSYALRRPAPGVMRAILQIALLLFVPAVSGRASEEFIHKLDTRKITSDSVTIAAQTFRFDVIRAVITRKQSNRNLIDAVHVTYGGRTIRIPQKALNPIGEVLMKTWQIRDEPGWLYIVVQAPHRTASGARLPKTIRFKFNRGRFRSVSTDTPLTKDSSWWQSIDY